MEMQNLRLFLSHDTMAFHEVFTKAVEDTTMLEHKGHLVQLG
jgi:hypothetical protein